MQSSAGGREMLGMRSGDVDIIGRKRRLAASATERVRGASLSTKLSKQIGVKVLSSIVQRAMSLGITGTALMLCNVASAFCAVDFTNQRACKCAARSSGKACPVAVSALWRTLNLSQPIECASSLPIWRCLRDVTAKQIGPVLVEHLPQRLPCALQDRLAA
jgi:hypothetical protein